LVTVAFMTTPVTAQAELNWYQGGVELAKGAPAVSVPTTGKITILIVGLRRIKCQMKGTEELWNPAPAGLGEDSVTRFELSRCTIQHSLCPNSKKVEVLPLALPWHSQLSLATPEGDLVKGVSLEVRCVRDHILHVLEGELGGPVGNGLLELKGTLGEAEPHREAIVELVAHLKARHGKITAH